MPALDDALVDALHRALEGELARESSVERASEIFADRLFTTVPALALVRVYALVPVRALPQTERAWIDPVAAKVGLKLHVRSSALALLATRGTHPTWNDRMSSREHRVVPYAPAFAERAPMLFRLVEDLRLTEPQSPTHAGVETQRAGAGGFNRLFYVDDARTRADGRGNKLVPQGDFVDANGIRTVFGFGGWIVGGMAITTILFSQEVVREQVAARIASLGATFKLAVLEQFRNGAIWSG